MNMKKAFAGVLASVVAISAMATTMVSAKNELTYTKAQEAYTKTWDFTGKEYKVTWENTFKSEWTTDFTTKTTATSTIVPAADGTVILGAGAADGTLNNASSTAYTVVLIDVAGVGTATPVATVNANTIYISVGTTPITAISGLPTGVTFVAAGVPTASDAGTYTLAAHKDATTVAGTVANYIAPNSFKGEATTSRIGFKFDVGTTTGVSIDSAKLVVTGYKQYDFKDVGGTATNSVVVKGNAALPNTTAIFYPSDAGYVAAPSTLGPVYFYKDPATTEYALTKDNDGYWYVDSVAAPGDPTSTGKIDLSSFLAITKAEVKYTSSTKKTADGKALDTKAKADDVAKADKTVSLTASVMSGTNGAFSKIVASMNNKSINSEKGKSDDGTVTHGVTMTGYDFDTVKGKNLKADGKYEDAWIASVVAKDTLYKLSNSGNQDNLVWNGKYFKGAVSGTNWFASESVDGKLTEDQYKTLAKDRLWAAKGDANVEETVVRMYNLVGALQDLIGDAKGATLTFSLYTGTTAATEKTPDEIKRYDNVAPLSSSANAEDFCVAVNYNASRNFYSKGVAKDGKIVINWDDVTKGLAAGTIWEMAIRIGSGKSFCVDSITVDVPAKTLADLSAGEAAEETTVALDTTAAPAADATTAAAANPTTGNAPIALAVIPVAIIAAAVVAKKRG